MRRFAVPLLCSAAVLAACSAGSAKNVKPPSWCTNKAWWNKQG